MPDREKVINGLEVCISRESGEYICYKCPYETAGNDCEIKMSEDALALLKEQEAVEPHIERGIDLESWFFGCGNCHFAIDYKDKFCRHCGREVKWHT